MYKRFIKRFLDIVLGLIGFPFFCLFFLVLAPIIFLTDKGPVFYTAPRLGRNGRKFKMYKFRSMKVNAPDIRNADGSTFNGANDPRVTKIGRIMRKMWVQFAKTGNPSLSGEISPYGRAYERTLYDRDHHLCILPVIKRQGI